MMTYVFKGKIIIGSTIVLLFLIGHSDQLKPETLRRKAMAGIMQCIGLDDLL